MTRLLKPVLLLAAIVIGGAIPAMADTWPSRSVRVLVPFAAGGATDIVARLVGQRLSERFGQQFVIDNRPGASGNIAITLAAKAPPDGHTLLATSSVYVVNPSLYPKADWKPADFTAISCMGGSANMLIVNPTVAARNPLELIALIKANPGKYSYASPGNGTTPHLAAELFRLVYGLDIVGVPFGGASPALQSTMQGQTPIAFMNLSNATEHVRSGAVRALAVTSARRSSAIPDVPTFAEAGVPDQESDTLQFMLAPAGTPRPIIELIHAEILRMIALPAFQTAVANLGFDVTANTPEQANQQIAAEIAKWAKVVRDAKIRAE